MKAGSIINRFERYRRQLKMWWEEYYMDNPVVWLLASSRTPTFTQNKLSDKADDQHLREFMERTLPEVSPKVRGAVLKELSQYIPRSAWNLKMPWQVLPLEKRIVFVLWLSCGALIALLEFTGWHRLLLSGFLRSVVLAFIVAFFMPLPFLGGFLRTFFLSFLIDPTQALYTGLTRLRGTHIVYGMLAHSTLSALRSLLLMGIPLLALLGFAFLDDIWRSLHFALITAFYLVVVAFWFSVFGAIRMRVPPRVATSSQTSLSIFPMLAGPVSVVTAVMLSRFLPTLSPIIPPPVWQWYALPLWWVSLIPPLMPFTLMLVNHPLWGIPQTILLLLTGILMIRRAVVHVERARLQPEPELVPDEGDW